MIEIASLPHRPKAKTTAVRVVRGARLAVMALCCAATSSPGLTRTANDASSLSPVAERFQADRPIVAAHRGCWGQGPENSLIGLKACIAFGVDIVEGDVRTTKDGVIVLMHDETLDRTTNFTGRVRDYTYAQLRAARLRDGKGGKDAPITDEPIPGLAEWLALARNKVYPLLDIKDADYDALDAVVGNAGIPDQAIYLISDAATDPRLRAARFVGRSPVIPIVQQCGFAPAPACYSDQAFASGKFAQDYALYMPLAFLTVSTDASFIKTAASAGWGATVKILNTGGDTEAGWAQIVAMRGVILTNRVPEALAFLTRKGLR